VSFKGDALYGGRVPSASEEVVGFLVPSLPFNMSKMVNVK